MKRLDLLKDLLYTEKLDALLLSSRESRFYATSADTSSGICLITRNEAFFLTDSRYIEASKETAEKAGYILKLVNSSKSYTDYANEILRKNSKVGFEADSMTVSSFNNWKKQLKCKLIPADNAVFKLRMIKEQWEIDNIISAQRIAERALNNLLSNFLEEGITEWELSAILSCQCLALGSEKIPFDPIVVSGENSSKPHGSPGERVIKKGDFVTMDFGATKNGYVSDMTRTVAVGEATDEMRNIYNIVLKAQEAGISAIKAGVPAKNVDAAARGIIEASGYGEYFGHGFGHGLGISVHEKPVLSVKSQEILQTNAVISAEPGIYLPGKFGVRIEDIVAVKPDGCENLTTAPKELLII